MNFSRKIKDFLTNLLAIEEDSDQELSMQTKSILHDYHDLIESQTSSGSNKINTHHIQKTGIITRTPDVPAAPSSCTPESRAVAGVPKDIYYPASLDGLKRQLAAMHQRNLALEQEVNRLNNEIVLIRERAKKLGAALFESAL